MRSLKSVVPCSAAIAFCATVFAAHAAPFDVYRAACLDTGVDLAKIRALAASQKWDKLTEAERDQLAPGSTRLEGWAVVKDGARHLVSVSGSTAGGGAGDRSGSAVVSCSMLGPKGDAKIAAKAYGNFLKRPPSTTETVDGLTTYTWSMQDASNLTLHYVVGGASMSGLSLSVSSIRK
jgi:hypothetical protein